MRLSEISRLPKLLGSILIISFAVLPCLAEEIPYANLFAPLPKVVEDPDNPISKAKVKLGHVLFMEPKLSKSETISCNTCHDLTTFGVDRRPVSAGHDGQLGDRNSPTVFNAALHISQFWDGRAEDVEEQALGPILNPVEMAMDADEQVIEKLRALPKYTQLFAEAFPNEKDPITFTNLGKAIGAFERTLLTPSRFDDYLSGKMDALSAEEKAGLETFVTSGCAACHNGAALGGGMYQKMGVVKPFATEDLGRYKVTKKESDKYVFKVPSLRNVAETGPYFHNGKVSSLKDAVKLMGVHQLGRDLPEEQVESIVTFLRSLTGDPGEVIPALN